MGSRTKKKLKKRRLERQKREKELAKLRSKEIPRYNSYPHSFHKLIEKSRIDDLSCQSEKNSVLSSELIYFYNLSPTDNFANENIILEFYRRMNLLGISRKKAEDTYVEESQSLEFWKKTNKYDREIKESSLRELLFDVRRASPWKNRYIFAGYFLFHLPDKKELSLSELIKITSDADTHLIETLKNKDGEYQLSSLPDYIVKSLVKTTTVMQFSAGIYQKEFYSRLANLGFSQDQANFYWMNELKLILSTNSTKSWNKTLYEDNKIYSPYSEKLIA